MTAIVCCTVLILKVSIGEISFNQVSDIPIHERFLFKSFRKITRLSKFLGRLLILYGS